MKLWKVTTPVETMNANWQHILSISNVADKNVGVISKSQELRRYATQIRIDTTLIIRSELHVSVNGRCGFGTCSWSCSIFSLASMFIRRNMDLESQMYFFLPSRFISHAVFNIHICSVEVNDVVQPNAPSPSLTTPLLPSPQKLPQYYDVIKQPMDLKMVAQRIQASEYNSLAELEADLQLVFRNACTFNEPGSQIYKDAKVLRKLAQTRRAEIEHARLTAAKSSERIRSVSRAGRLRYVECRPIVVRIRWRSSRWGVRAFIVVPASPFPLNDFNL